MKKPAHVIEIFLQPGEFYFGDRNTRIRTVLGSCVSITMWHPRLLIGGMCHFMLSRRPSGQSGELDGRYADEAMALFLREIRDAGTQPAEYQVKLFGGGNMFPASMKLRNGNCHPPTCDGTVVHDCRQVSCANSRIARHLAVQNGFRIAAEHLGETGHRQILFDIWSGHVWVKHNPIIPIPPCMAGQPS
ncbi:MAG: chemotaxis protein CheD [Sulfuricella sp.]|nr:chemotaxis protein CheD [Sulfuricella sp.]